MSTVNYRLDNLTRATHALPMPPHKLMKALYAERNAETIREYFDESPAPVYPTLRSLAEKYGVSFERIRQILSRDGRYDHKPKQHGGKKVGYTSPDIAKRNAEIVRLYLSPEQPTLAEIGAKYGIHNSNVAAIVKKAGALNRKGGSSNCPSITELREKLKRKDS